MILLVQVVSFTRKAALPQLLAMRLVKALRTHSVRGSRLPAPQGLPLGMRHEDAVVMAVLNGNIVKLIVAARAHENAKVVGDQHGVADDIVVESQIERYAGAGIIMEVKLGKQAILRVVTGQAVELVVKRRQILHGQPPHARAW